MKLLIYLLGIVGATGSLIYSFDFSVNLNLIFGVCIVVGLLIFYGYLKIKNKRQFVIGGLIFDGILLILPNTIACFSYLVSIVVLKYRSVSVYNLSFQSVGDFYENPYVCIAAFLLIFIPMYLLATIAIDKNKYILAIMALLPGVFIELLFTITPPWFFISCFVLYFMVLFVSAMQKGIKVKPPIIGICLFSMIFTYLAFGTETYRLSSISLFNKSKTPLATAGNLNDYYNVNEQGDRYYRNSIDFIIEGASEMTDFKLRGISYDQYDNGTWIVYDDQQTYNNRINRNLNIVNKVVKTKTQTLKIEQLSGYSYRNYAPYYFTNEDLTNFGNYVVGENPQTYEMVVPNKDFNDILTSVDRNVKSDLINEIANKKGTQDDLEELRTGVIFNNDTLTSVSKKDITIIDQFLSQNNISFNGNVYDYINQCKEALAKQTNYTLRPGELPDEENYLNYFLNVNKRGYCVHYASSLALMLRRNGIAARFALGYQVSNSKNASGQLLVRDRDEHAWVEIFDEYFGWIPIEAIGSGVTNEDNDSISTTVPTNNQNNNQIRPITPVQNQDKEAQDTKVADELPLYWYGLGIFIVGLISFVLQAIIRKKRMFKGVTTNNQLVCYYYYYLDKLNADTDSIKEIADKARFSPHEITDEERIYVYDHYCKQIKIVYKKANFIKKIYYKYILAYI